MGAAMVDVPVDVGERQAALARMAARYQPQVWEALLRASKTDPKVASVLEAQLKAEIAKMRLEATKAELVALGPAKVAVAFAPLAIRLGILGVVVYLVVKAVRKS